MEVPNRPLVKFTDMSPGVLAGTLEAVEAYCSKGPEKNMDAVPALLKQSVERRFGGTWHVCIGEGYGFDVSYQKHHMCHLVVGKQGLVIYKS